MATLVLHPENQIQRLNVLVNKVENLQAMHPHILTTPPSPKAWSIVEIIAHLSISYGHYRDKVERTLAQSPTATPESNVVSARLWQKFVIEGQRPKGNRRRWKMKTLKKFEPLLPRENLSRQKLDEVFATFKTLHEHLKQSILASRQRDMSRIKITSAIGPIVNFYLPECFEFLLCHAERHMVQIQEILDSQS